MTNVIDDAPDNVWIGRDLELWREKMGISIRHACEMLEISQGRWQRMTSGESPIPAHIELACERLLELAEPG